MHKKAKRNDTSALWAKFRNLQNDKISKIRESKELYYKNLSDRIATTNSSDPKTWWKLVKSFNKQNAVTERQYPPIWHNDTFITDAVEKAYICHKF